jgi:hypothetical protein
MTTGIASDEPIRHLIAQPVSRASHNADVFGFESDLFVQLSVHRLFGRFAPVDATLWELPGVGPDPFAPKYLVLLVEQNDADIGPEAFSVKHNQPQIF